MHVDTVQEHLVQNAAGTVVTPDPSLDDGGRRAGQELQASIAQKAVRLPPQDTIQLWEKATADPASLTDDEKLQVLERWPLSEFNEKCQAICGKSLEELLEKAVHSPNDLTHAETGVIIYGVEKRTLEHDPTLDRLRWPSDLLTLRREAQKAAETQRDRTAKKHAQEAEDRARDQKDKARELLTEDDRKNIIWCNRSQWASKLNEERPGKRWGFALYRTCFVDDQAWQKFQQNLKSATQTAFAFVKDAEKVRKLWEIYYIEDKELEGASLAKLAADFRHRTSSSAEAEKAIPSHLRHDALLYADSEAIRSALVLHRKSAAPERPQRSWVYAVDVTFTEASLGSYKHGFQGWVRVCLPNVLTTFFARLAPRGSAGDKPEETNKMMQSWDAVYYKSRYDPRKVYPPTSLYNRGG